ncbi:hybrid sensor histidine kinase/response regulator [Candidatus Venteria ishoeyi]|uniref:histidine kinase n=1 Tax=Candidatus Venteria ishoeyi TaxID=1899563 RepID=A0A1H6FDB7_9GAMM|nr:hybrid sensor histidine kinase/response regulator [Candidatus Venteria ishoeyi]SEH07156.1 Autoinducer 2 sensor kinase/phosphatase LuxQ [Candidatus Venteria ishoeyi]
MPDSIMIVDDNPDNLAVLKGVLSNHGYQVRPTNSGKMVLKSLQHRMVDLILLDIRMPEMDGYEVCRQLKENPETQEIPVIFISALDDPRDKIKAFETGAVDYVSKPFNEMEVLARVSTHLQLHHLQQDLARQNEVLEELVAKRTEKLKQSNTALSESNAALEKALQVKNEFLMLMSHEFRTPLNGILGMTSFLKNTSDETQRENIEIIDSSGWRLLKLVDNILETTKQGTMDSATKVQLHQAIDIRHLCDESLQTIAQLALKKHITVHLNPKYLKLLEIPMNTSRLRQVIGNLLDNAVNFSPEHSQIGIDIQYAQDSQQLFIDVWDSAETIPNEEQHRIFDPFVQLCPITTRSHEGPGLGLTLARNLVELHGGQIQVTEREEQGNIFEISLPAKPI